MAEDRRVSCSRRRGVVLGSAGAAALGALSTVGLTRLALHVADGSAGAGPAALLTTVSTAACAVVCGRLTLCLGIVAITAAMPSHGAGRRRGRRVALALGPAWMRPTIGLLLAVGITAGTAGCEPASRGVRTVASTSAGLSTAAQQLPRTMTPTPTSGAPPGASTGPARTADSAATARVPAGTQPPAAGLPDPEWQVLLDPGWRAPPPPAAPLLAPGDASLVTSGAHGAASALTHPRRTIEDRVVVRRGDTLWAIAARSLGHGASAAEVASEWPRWWRANRAVIGPDPDSLQPGTRLRPPK